MPKSYRIRTSVNGFKDSDKTLRVQINQDFDFLEVLSLKLTQSDIYNRFCSDYGVIIGRVVANGGFGVPNAKVSVFVPLDAVDENDPIISTLYPYKDVSDKNEDGYRYNLLPYEPSYEGHVPTGTFPTREDVLTRKEVLQIYEKYYKYTVKTNESGDYMIVGVPLGNQRIVLDVDLSDMGCFSLRPTDLIRMGRATETQFDGNQFRSSEDLASLPQLITQTKSISVTSFWGADDVCDVGITRVDFDLRDSNITIEPVATFMGSIMSSNKRSYLRRSCKVTSEQGDLCGMVSAPGRILAIRQTIQSDRNGDPLLEQHVLPQGGNVIDENGAFVVDVPMNLDYLTTNEFGELVISNDPKVGIPTKGKYRFKIKWIEKDDKDKRQLEPVQTGGSILNPVDTLNLQAFNPRGELVRANYLVPNIKEYGWVNKDADPAANEPTKFSEKLQNESLQTQEYVSSSFSPNTTIYLDNIDGEYQNLTLYRETGPGTNIFETVNSRWIDLARGGRIKAVVDKRRKSITFGSGTNNLQTWRTVKLNFKQMDGRYAAFQKSYSFSLNWNDYPDKDEAIQCKDFFYEFNFNKVYTTAQLIDEYRGGSNGANGRGNFLSIKEILERSCESEVNKFPVNDGVRNFDLLYFIISILFQILTIPIIILIIVYHIIKFLWNKYTNFVIGLFVLLAGYQIYSIIQDIAADTTLATATFGAALLKIYPSILRIIAWTTVATLAVRFAKQLKKFKFPSLKLPMLTYPDCSTCDCGNNDFAVDSSDTVTNLSPLADINSQGAYANTDLVNESATYKIFNAQGRAIFSAGRQYDLETPEARTPSYWQRDQRWQSQEAGTTWRDNPKSTNQPRFSYLTLPERVNLFNTKLHYFDSPTNGHGANRIKVYPNYKKNNGQTDYKKAKSYEDQPLIVLIDPDQIGEFVAGNLISFVNPNSTKDINIISGSTTPNELGTYSVTGTTPASGSTQINISYADPKNVNGIKTVTGVNIEQNLYNGKGSYNFASDIEYYQVITAITVGDAQKLVDNSLNKLSGIGYDISFYRRVIQAESAGRRFYFTPTDDDEDGKNGDKFGDIGLFRQLELIQDYKSIGILFLMKGIDPYTTRQETKIDLSLPLGLKPDTFVVESKYKLNIPIQPGGELARHDKLVSNISTPTIGKQIFFNSYILNPTAGNLPFQFSGYNTNRHLLYSNLDSSVFDNAVTGQNSIENKGKLKSIFNIGTSVPGIGYTVDAINKTKSYGGLKNYFIGNRPDTYYSNEYVEGGSFMYMVPGGGANKAGATFENGSVNAYIRSVYDPTGTTMSISNNSKIIMRTDRLPRSDGFEVDFVLAQNGNFAIYQISDEGIGSIIGGNVNSNSDFSTGQAGAFSSDYGTGTTSLLSTFSCTNMVPLGAYTDGPDGNITVKDKQDSVYYTSDDKDYPKMQNGCYRLVEKDLAIGSDIQTFAEWRIRFIFGLALCRNVFGMTFTNQWINGVLYMPGFQNEKVYLDVGSSNGTPRASADPNFPRYLFCREKIVFKEGNNSFFYRSSPYDGDNGKFVGMQSDINSDEKGSNKLFLGNPTTIVDLGPKDDIIKNICPKPEFRGYKMDRLDATTFNEIGDITQLFIISRLSNTKFLQQLFVANDAAVSQLFSRPGKKLDGDFVQAISVNSELGVIPFSPETYTDKSLFIEPLPGPIVGIFYSADTYTRDLMTPGREIFIDTPNKFAYNYFGIKSQVVPMYRWGLKQEGSGSLFGSEKNNWVTDSDKKFAILPYQGIDRLLSNTYFESSYTSPTSQRPGYIYDSIQVKNSSGVVTGFTFNGKLAGKGPSEFVVGAPFHFYFGLKAGKSAFDIFLRKNLIDI